MYSDCILYMRQEQQLLDVMCYKWTRFQDFKICLQSSASQKLTMVNRGAVKLLQAFVNQLPQQDLRHGLPSHFPELANLVRQVTLLSAGAALNGEVKDRLKVKGKDNLSDVESGLMAQIAHVEVIGKNWKLHYINPKGKFILSPQEQRQGTLV